MTESLPTLVTDTANGVAGAIVANIPGSVMASLEFEQAGPAVESSKESETRDAPWGYQICPHGYSSRKFGIANSRIHLFAVAGLLVTGALVIYTTALHMGYWGSEQAAVALFTLPSADFTVQGTIGSHNSSAGANSSVAANSSAGANPIAEFKSGAAANSSIVANSSISSTSIAGANSSVLVNLSAVAYPPLPSSPNIQVAALPPTATIDETPGPIANPPPPVYFQNMSATWHSMSDEEMLRKATSREALRRASIAGPSTLAFLFMVRGDVPFAPLWERFFRGHGDSFRVYMHAHPDYVPGWDPSSPFFGRYVPSKLVQWGRLSVYEAERRLLGNALMDPSNSWFLLLSESCIPLFSFSETYAYFNDSPGVNFIESFQDPSHIGNGRLFRAHFKAMEPEITTSNFRKGSQWFHITRDLALLVARDSPEYTKFKKYFCKIHPTCYIDEHFMATFAWIKSPNAIAFRTLTYYEFHGKSAHPRKFGKLDTNKNLMRWLREGHNCTYNGEVTSKCFLFVRKFHPDALSILLDLVGPVMGIP